MTDPGPAARAVKRRGGPATAGKRPAAPGFVPRDFTAGEPRTGFPGRPAA